MLCIVVIGAVLWPLVAAQNADSYGSHGQVYDGYAVALTPPQMPVMHQPAFVAEPQDRFRHFFHHNKHWKHHFKHKIPPHYHTSEYVPVDFPIPFDHYPHTYAHPSTYQPLAPPSTYQPVPPSTYQPARPSVYRPVSPSTYQPVPSSAYHHVPPSMPPPAHHHVPIYNDPHKYQSIYAAQPKAHVRNLENDDPIELGNQQGYRYNEPAPQQYSPPEVQCGSNGLVACEPFVRAVPCDYANHYEPTYYAPPLPVPVLAPPPPPPLPSPPLPPSYAPLDTYYKPGPPYEAVNLQLVRQQITSQNDTSHQVNSTSPTNTDVNSTAATAATTTPTSDHSVDQTTAFVDSTTTEQSKQKSDETIAEPDEPSTPRNAATATIRPPDDVTGLALESMAAEAITLSPAELEHREWMDAERAAHLERVAKFRVEAAQKIQHAIERSNQAASDEFVGSSAEFQSNRI